MRTENERIKRGRNEEERKERKKRRGVENWKSRIC